MPETHPTARTPSRCCRAACWGAVWLASLTSVHGGAGSGTAARGGLATLDGLVGRWMALRTSIADERRAWDACRAQWEDEIALLQQEAETLGKEVEESDAFAVAFERDRADVMARKDRMEAEAQALRAVLERAEDDLRQWRGRIPAGLLEPLASGFGLLPASRKAADPLPLTKRAQTVAALYTQIELLQSRFHATHETLDVRGARRRVDVLYVGLARAFAVSQGNDWAAVGTPSDAGWSWTPSVGDALAVRRAIDVLNRRETAQMVALPLQVAGEEQP